MGFARSNTPKKLCTLLDLCVSYLRRGSAHGNRSLREMLPKCKFIGNCEGRDIFSSEIDVIVCDGFTGNIVLKEVEGIYSIMKKRGLLDDFFKRFNYEDYGGTPILGLNKTVIIGHGISNEIAIKNMIILTKDIVEAKLNDKIKETLK